MIHENELIVDSFAGGGGASTGIFMALGRHPDVAINHDPEAIAMHMANHPDTQHFCQSIYQVDPADVIREHQKRIGLCWFSPDCTHHSKARGGVPKQKHIRDLAWIVVHWAERATYKGKRPRVLVIENVEEFQDWCPLLPNGQPDPDRKGEEFKRWLKALRKLGYIVEFQVIRASDYGAPTIRKRLFIVARCDGEAIVWPEPTHGPGRALPYRTAAECIDWSLPCPSIFLAKADGRAIRAKRPLAPATMRRASAGIRKFVLDAKQPYIVDVGAQHTTPFVTKFRTGSTGSAIDTPLHTITAGGKSARPAGAAHAMGLMVPIISEHANATNPRSWTADEPLRTQCAEVKGGHFTLLSAHVQRQFGESVGSDMREPVGTATTVNKTAVCAASMMQMGYGEREGQAPRTLNIKEPLGTVVAGSVKHAMVAAHLAQHNNHQNGGVNVGRSVLDPVSTITASGSQQGLVTSHLMKLRGTCQHGQPVDEPMATVSAQGTHIAAIAGSLVAYYGSEQDGANLNEPMRTVTSRDRFGLIESGLAPEPLTAIQLERARAVADLMREHGHWTGGEFVTLEMRGVVWIIVDIGMRMLTPPELYKAQGFPDDYIIAPLVNGKPLTKTAQVRMCGNSVSPEPARALVNAQFTQDRETDTDSDIGYLVAKRQIANTSTLSMF